MMKNKILMLLYLVSLISCTETTPKKVLVVSKSRALKFLISKDFKLYHSKNKIPSIVIDSLSSINNQVFEIGDASDTGKINLSDFSINNIFIDSSSHGVVFKIRDTLGIDKDKPSSVTKIEYNKLLHFVLLNDSSCLISYTEGGIGVHDVTDFIQYKGAFVHTRYVTTALLGDTTLLGNYLRTNPKPEFETIE
jgi:hypothetical protein